jgi:anti-sigma factor RsiW
VDGCLPDEDIAAYVDRAISGERLKQIEYHLVECRRCRRVVALVVRSQTVVPDPDFRDSSE